MSMRARFGVCVLVLVVLAALSPAGATEWYVATNGLSTNNGSINSPWDIAKGFNTTSVVAGDTVWLRGGTYLGNNVFYPHFTGTSSQPIKVRAYPGERVILKGNTVWNQLETLQLIYCTYTWFWGLEITSSVTDRVSAQSGPWPTDIDIAGCMTTTNGGSGCKLINMVMHDCAGGIGGWNSTIGFEATGCIIYFNGWQAPDRGHGHGNYSQNNTGTKLYQHNIIFANYGNGTQCYGSDAAYVNNITETRNIFFDNGILANNSTSAELIMGGGNPSENIVATYNRMYRRNGGIGFEMGDPAIVYMSAQNISGTAENNYMFCGSRVWDFQNNGLSYRWNTVIGPSCIVWLDSSTVGATPTYNWNWNTYHCTETPNEWGEWQPFWQTYSGTTPRSWSQYRTALSYDANSTYSTSYPTTTVSFVELNPYESGRGNVAVFNWSDANSVNVDVSSVVANGASYVVKDVQNYFGTAVASGTYGGGSISIPMNTTTVMQPAGNPPVAYAHTPKRFGAFVITSGAASNVAPTVSAGSPQTINWPTNTLTASGTVSDDGLPNPPASVVKLWTKTSGPGTVTFATPSASSTVVTFSTTGTYVLNLDANDSVLHTSSTVTMKVNLAPSANAGSDQAIALPTNTVSLSGSISDDGIPSGTNTCTWSKDSGTGTVTFANASAASTTATFSTNGTYVLRLTANDTSTTGYDTVTITVGPPAFMESGGRVVMEAENYHASYAGTGSYSGHSWSAATDLSGYSGASAMHALPSITLNAGNTTDGPRMEYQVSFASTGTHYIWVRMAGPNTNDNSLHTGLDGVGASLRGMGMEDPNSVGTWLWTKLADGTPVSVNVATTGTHVVDVWMREDGCYIDKILLTTDPNYTPTGTGPAESSRVGANAAPTVDAGSTQTTNWAVSHTASLAGTVSDDGLPSGSSVTVTWSKDSGPGTVTFTNANAASTTATFSAIGSYVLRLTASDSALQEYDTVTIIVNSAPTVEAGSNQVITLPTNTVSLAATVSDDGLPAGTNTRAWTKDSGAGTVTFADANAASTTATFSTSGTYVLRMTASDSVLQTYDTVTITVNPANAAPTANAGNDQTITLPATASLVGSVSDDGQPNPPAVVSKTWSKDSGLGTVTFADANALSTTATFSTAGTYVLRLTANDSALTGYDTVTVTVNPAPIGLEMHLRLDEGTGTSAADNTGHGHTGTLTNGPTWVAGEDANAVQFDESNDYVLVNDFAYGPSFTVSFWFKCPDNTGNKYQYIYSHGTVEAANSLNIYIAEASEGVISGKMRASFRDADDGGVTTSLDVTAPIDSYWHLYTVTVETGVGTKVYLDGSSVATDANRGGGTFNPTTNVYLGARCDLGSARYYGGAIDDVRVYTRALSSTEVDDLYLGY